MVVGLEPEIITTITWVGFICSLNCSSYANKLPCIINSKYLPELCMFVVNSWTIAFFFPNWYPMEPLYLKKYWTCTQIFFINGSSSLSFFFPFFFFCLDLAAWKIKQEQFCQQLWDQSINSQIKIMRTMRMVNPSTPPPSPHPLATLNQPEPTHPSRMRGSIGCLTTDAKYVGVITVGSPLLRPVDDRRRSSGQWGHRHCMAQPMGLGSTLGSVEGWGRGTVKKGKFKSGERERDC